ncbi:MAG: 2-amino-4-hydroxy-6-hydroxymethyldihydropteridine diphosphokinase [Rhodoferax sp.]|nr:2-amino-4-hydroxy-6-hydroxymethyldihydropteridine diphosphokinase [Rhodoferax sp.]
MPVEARPAQGVKASVLAYIGLGANLGDPRAAVTAAIRSIAALPGIRLTRQSSLYGSAPIDAGGGDYVNAVVEVQTPLEPHALLAQLQVIENAAGRARPYRNAPRTLDLDVLLYDALALNNADLVLPHPRMWERAFVLRPLAEIAPALVSPAQLQAVADQSVWVL